MKTLKKAIVYYASFPLDFFFVLPIILVVRVLWGEKLRWKYGVLSTLFKSESFPLGGKVDPITGFLQKKRFTFWPLGFYLVNRKEAFNGSELPRPWNGSSLCHGHLYGPYMRGTNITTSTEIHELHHTTQAEVSQLSSMFLSHLIFVIEFLQGDYLTGLILLGSVWIFGGIILTVISGWAHAYLVSHPEGVYKGSCHELGAYAIGDMHRLKRDQKNEFR